MIALIFFILSFVPHVVKNTPANLALVKKVRDRARVYRQHIKQPGYQKLKVEEHLITCGKCTFKIFPLLQMQRSETDLRRSYERNFMKKYKTKLNSL